MDLPPTSISVCGCSVVLVVLVEAEEGVKLPELVLRLRVGVGGDGGLGVVGFSGADVENGRSVESGFELGGAVNIKPQKILF